MFVEGVLLVVREFVDFAAVCEWFSLLIDGLVGSGERGVVLVLVVII